MKNHQDAYGHQVYDFYTGKGGYEIVERDDGHFSISGGAPYYFAEYKNWRPHEKQGLKYARGRVLDIGCGAGRHALYLQKKGMAVVGVDQSPLAVKVCKLRGLKEAKVIPITQISPKLGIFDTIIMLGNNFGLFGSYKRAKWLLKRFHRLTSPNAKIIAESRNPYATKNPFHLNYHKLNRSRGRMSGQLRIRIRYQSYATPWFDYLLVSPDEMKKILAGTGWQVNRFLKFKDASYIAIIEKDNPIANKLLS